MVITHRTYTRPGPDVLWHTDFDIEINSSPDITREFIRLDTATIVDSKKFRTKTTPDDLTLVVEVVWFNDEDHRAWVSNESIIAYLNAVRAYYEQINGTIVDKPVSIV